jgi:hypothetical protein
MKIRDVLPALRIGATIMHRVEVHPRGNAQ